MFDVYWQIHSQVLRNLALKMHVTLGKALIWCSNTENFSYNEVKDTQYFYSTEGEDIFSIIISLLHNSPSHLIQGQNPLGGLSKLSILLPYFINNFFKT